MHFNEISGAVVDAAMKVHSALGPGLLESVYLACLVHELNRRGFRTAVQLPLPVVYEGVRLDLGFRLDILVENFVVVEIKAVEAITPVHQAQLLTYLKLSHSTSGF
jgi:GxxExxY protein